MTTCSTEPQNSLSHCNRRSLSSKDGSPGREGSLRLPASLSSESSPSPEAREDTRKADAPSPEDKRDKNREAELFGKTKKHLARKFLSTRGERVTHLTQRVMFSKKEKNHLKYTAPRKIITFIREADTRAQLEDDRQILFS